MKLMRYVIPLLLVLPAIAWGQTVDLSLKGDGVRVVKVDRVITIKEDATIVQSFPVTVSAPKGAGLYFWTYSAGVTAIDKNDTLDITLAPKGSVVVNVKSVNAELDKDGKFIGFKTYTGSVTFTVGDVPVPPGPDPKPDPKPDPVIPAPLPIAGVLMIEESDDRAKITKGQYNALFGATMRDYLIANVAKEDGQPALRILDKDQATLGMAKHWQDAAKRRPANFTTPWLIISNGVTGWEGPMPANEEDTKALITKYLMTKGAR